MNGADTKVDMEVDTKVNKTQNSNPQSQITKFIMDEVVSNKKMTTRDTHNFELRFQMTWQSFFIIILLRIFICVSTDRRTHLFLF